MLSSQAFVLSSLILSEALLENLIYLPCFLQGAFHMVLTIQPRLP